MLACSKAYTIITDVFVNLHMHLGGSLYKDLPIDVWQLKEYIEFSDFWNAKLKTDGCDKIAWNKAACLSLALSLENGVTNIGTILGSDICNRFNLKNCLIGYPIMKSQKLSSYICEAEDAYSKFRESNQRLGLYSGVFFHSLYANDQESLDVTKRILQSYPEDFLQIHCAEEEYTLSETIKLWGKSPINVLDDNGLLNSNTFIVHGCLLSEEELELIGDKGAKVIICPISNLRVGQLPINPKLLNKYNIDWFIGSDGLGTGSTMNLREQAFCLKQIYPTISYYDLWDAITSMPYSLTKSNDSFCVFELDRKYQKLSSVFEFLITNYSIMPKKVCIGGCYMENDKNIYDISKYEPTFEEFCNWKKKGC